MCYRDIVPYQSPWGVSLWYVLQRQWWCTFLAWLVVHTPLQCCQNAVYIILAVKIVGSESWRPGFIHARFDLMKVSVAGACIDLHYPIWYSAATSFALLPIASLDPRRGTAATYNCPNACAQRLQYYRAAWVDRIVIWVLTLGRTSHWKAVELRFWWRPLLLDLCLLPSSRFL